MLHARPGPTPAAVEASLVEDEVKAVDVIVGRVLVRVRVWAAVVVGGVILIIILIIIILILILILIVLILIIMP